MEFVLIPAGEFDMGSPPSEEGRLEYEGPVHRVTLSRAFRIGKYPVTQRQYEAVTGENPSHFSGNIDRPVDSVSWEDAVAFCRKLGARDGRAYRLPTEAQWEYACRAGSTSAYCFGDDPSLLPQYAWYRDNSGMQTHPVGEKKPNAFGVYDMHGNVWEWCHDYYYGSCGSGFYGWHYYRVSPNVDPQGPDIGASRVLRGGSWDDDPGGCRSADRGGFWPDCRNFRSGFRVVLLPAPISPHFKRFFDT
jgi:formylglycine-generating enzyme required for sulfatase activity